MDLEALLTLAEKIAKGVNFDTVNVGGDKVNTDKVNRRSKVNRPHWKQRVCQSEHRRVYGSLEETLEMGMTQTQKEVFLMVDEWWKRFGFSPTVREIALWRKKGVSNTQKVIDRLVKIGALKRVDGMQRTLRPTYVNFRNLE